jgi:hypothetical protein
MSWARWQKMPSSVELFRQPRTRREANAMKVLIFHPMGYAGLRVEAAE